MGFDVNQPEAEKWWWRWRWWLQYITTSFWLILFIRQHKSWTDKNFLFVIWKVSVFLVKEKSILHTHTYIHMGICVDWKVFYSSRSFENHIFRFCFETFSISARPPILSWWWIWQKRKIENNIWCNLNLNMFDDMLPDIKGKLSTVSESYEKHSMMIKGIFNHSELILKIDKIVRIVSIVPLCYSYHSFDWDELKYSSLKSTQSTYPMYY